MTFVMFLERAANLNEELGGGKAEFIAGGPGAGQDRDSYKEDGGEA